MSGDSAHAGYLTPEAAPAPEPLQDDAFDTFIHDVLVGLTGFDGKLVVPAFQQEPPTQPDRDVDWIAFGVQHLDADTYAAEQHVAAADGVTQLQRHETVEVLVSSYGPNAARTLAVLRDGLQVEQNREVLRANAMGLQETGAMRRAPTLTKDKWLNRYDMPFVFRRQIRRTYTVYNLASAHGVLNTEGAQVIQTQINVVPQP